MILNRAPSETIDWADTVASWGFERVIPCHLDAPIEANRYQFRQAFAFLEQREDNCALPEADFQLLKEIDNGLNKLGIVPPAKERV